MQTLFTMKKRLCLWLMTLCLILLGQAGNRVYAQNPQTIEVGPHFGASSYIGELNTWRNLDQWKWKEFNQFNYDWGVLARYNYDSRWAFRFDYTRGNIRACDSIAAWRPEALLNFQSTVNDFSLLVEFNFLDYYTGHVTNVISPYIFGGISAFTFNTKAFTKDVTIDTVSLQKGFSMSIPFGIGCKISLTNHLAASLEWRMHYTFSDGLDNVNGLYPADASHKMLVSATRVDDQGNPVLNDGKPIIDYKVSTGNPGALAPGETLVYDFSDPAGKYHENQQRGNSQTNDWFGFINLSLTWKFVIPNNSACKMNVY